MDSKRAEQIVSTFVARYGACDEYPGGESRWHELLSVYKNGYLDGFVDQQIEREDEKGAQVMARNATEEWWFPQRGEDGEYKTHWDHLGDAEEQFKKVADAYLESLEYIAELRATVNELNKGEKE